APGTGGVAASPDGLLEPEPADTTGIASAVLCEDRAVRRMLRAAALVLWPVLVPLVFAGIPIALSYLGTRQGWHGGRPGGWNLAGIVPLAGGAALIAWVLAAHYRAAPAVGWEVGRGKGLAY